MLNKMRSGFLSGFFMVMLILGGAGIAFMDMGSFFNNGVGSGNVAKVGDDKINTLSFHKTVTRNLNNRISTQEAYQRGYIDQILNNEIRSLVLKHSAINLGIIINDDVVFSQIENIVKGQPKSEMSKKEAFENYLRSIGMTKEEYIKEIRAKISASILINALTSGTALTSDKILMDMHQFNNELRNIEIITLNNSDIKLNKMPSQDELTNFYEARKVLHKIPETRNFSILYFSPDDLKKEVNISKEEIKIFYDANIDAFTIEETRALEQSVFETKDNALELISRLDNSNNFQELSKEISDTNNAFLSKDKYLIGDLQTEYAKKVFNSNEGDIIGPIKTVMGWHVIKLLEINKSKQQKLSEVKADIQTQLEREKLGNRLLDIADYMDERIGNDDTIDMISKDQEIPFKIQKIANMEAISIIAITKDDLDMFNDDREHIIRTAFELTEGELSSTFELSNGGFASIQLDQITEEHYPDYEDVKSLITTEWKMEQKRIKNILSTKQNLDKINSKEKTFKETAKEYEVKITKFKNIDRNNNKVSSKLLKAVFNSNINQVIMINDYDKIILARATSNTLPNIKDIKEKELKDIEPYIQSAIIEEIFTSFYSYNSKELNVKINKALIEAMYKAKSDIE